MSEEHQHVSRPINRITVITNVHYEHDGEQPVTIPLSYSKLLSTGEDTYSRRIIASEEFVAIDYGFVGDTGVSLLLVESLVGKDRQVNPTPAEAEAEAAKVVELSCGILVPPGEHRIIHVADFSELKIRCQSGTARVRVTSIPR